MYDIVLSMNEVDSMCKNVKYLADKLQDVRACQGYQSQVCYMAMVRIIHINCSYHEKSVNFTGKNWKPKKKNNNN